MGSFISSNQDDQESPASKQYCNFVIQTPFKMTIAPVIIDRASFSFSTINKHEKTSSHSGISIPDDGDSDCQLPSDVAARLVQRTEMRVSQVLSNSQFIKTNCTLYNKPQFEREELHLGPVIASGGFSNVFEIKGFATKNQLNTGFNKGKQYILKSLEPKLASDLKKLVVGAKDIVMEAHFLSSLKHKNIMELRGWCAPGIAGFSEAGRADGFFLVFDYLPETLTRRISQWREISKANQGPSIMNGRGHVRRQLYMERLEVAIDIASAVEYLHENRIIYRDLKPANIGFDQDGTLKIFDFGLAVEVPAGRTQDSAFNLPGKTGTSRYMAVEVIRSEPYNMKADVFSFSVLLWEIMALAKPYNGLPGDKVQECVSLYGERPAIPRAWPKLLRQVLKEGWTESIKQRPSMKEVKDALVKLHAASFRPKMFSF